MIQNKRMFGLWGVVCFCVFAHCTSPKHFILDPKQSITNYITQSFAIKNPEDKRELLKFLTADVKSRLESWNEQQFKEAFIDSRRQFIRLLFKDTKEISANEVQITYELTYMDRGRSADGQVHEARITNKKLSQLLFIQGKWLIADVHNIKELVEYVNELSIP